MIINVHAGHNPDGKAACGAVGLIKESTEARRVKDEVIRLLRAEGHTVYDCTCENGTSQSDVLKKIVQKCNAHAVDLDISIHFNAGRNDRVGDGMAAGTEAWIYSMTSEALNAAGRVLQRISALGYPNRGIKTSTDLYVLKHTKAPAMLVECCFVDDRDDVKMYDAPSMAIAIVEGILGKILNPNEMRVKVRVKNLNIRKEPKKLSKKMGAIKDKGTYTIVEKDKSGNWGRLKSGAGWICIKTKYVKYL